MVQIPLVDLRRQHAQLRRELDAAYARVVESGGFVLGEEVLAFEREIAEYLKVRFAIGVSNGSDALVLALSSLGVGPGDEVITTPYSFFATLGSVLRVGATPRFADIGTNSFNIDPEAVREQLSPRTKAVLCVHLFGSPADTRALRPLCSSRGIPLIEDAAQALGASLGPDRVGSLGDIACFSFFPSKPLGALGDGGLITTNSAQLAERCRLMRVHGAVSPHDHRALGGNHRLDTLQAAFLRAKLPHLGGWLDARNELANRYDDLLADCEDLLPRTPELEGASSTIAHYTVRLRNGRAAHRNALARHLRGHGVQAAVYYPRLMFEQRVPELESLLRHQPHCPNARARTQDSLSLPLFPELRTEEQDRVVAVIREFFAQ